MAGLLKTPSFHLSPTPFHAPDAVPLPPFRFSFSGGRFTAARASLSYPSSSSASLRFASGKSLRLLRFVGFASGESEATEAEAGEPEIQDTEGVVDVEEEEDEAQNSEDEETEVSVAAALLQSYKEALSNNDESKITEIEASLKAIEDEKTEIEKKLSSLSNDLSAEKDRVLRISADFDNFRKRTERDRLSLVTNAQGEAVESLLTVLDNFERAKTQIKVETEGEDKINGSYQSIYKQFAEVLGSLGVVPVETIGKQFDPMQHEAIMREESEEYEEGVVIEEYRKGFVLGERLLRPSMVKVSAGPGPAKPGQAEEKPNEEEEEKEVIEEGKEEADT